MASGMCFAGAYHITLVGAQHTDVGILAKTWTPCFHLNLWGVGPKTHINLCLPAPLEVCSLLNFNYGSAGHHVRSSKDVDRQAASHTGLITVTLSGCRVRSGRRWDWWGNTIIKTLWYRALDCSRACTYTQPGQKKSRHLDLTKQIVKSLLG